MSRTISCSRSQISKDVKVEERKVHIVYMGALPQGVEYSTNREHLTLLSSVVGGDDVITS